MLLTVAGAQFYIKAISKKITIAETAKCCTTYSILLVLIIMSPGCNKGEVVDSEYLY